MTSITVLADHADSRGELLHAALEGTGAQTKTVDLSEEPLAKADGYVYLSCGGDGDCEDTLESLHPMFNSYESLVRTSSKHLYTGDLKRNGVPVPITRYATGTLSALASGLMIPSEKIIFKPVDLSYGIGVDIEEKASFSDFVRGVVCAMQNYRTCIYPPVRMVSVQEYVPNDGVLKVLTLGGESYAGLYFRNTEGCGYTDFSPMIGRPFAEYDVDVVKLTDAQKRVASRAAKTVGLDFCTVDMLEHPKRGPVVLEANSCSGWNKYEDRFHLGYPDALAKYIVGRVEKANL